MKNGRPKKSRIQYMREYWRVIDDIRDGVSYRKIAKDRKVGLSTVQRLANKFIRKY